MWHSKIFFKRLKNYNTEVILPLPHDFFEKKEALENAAQFLRRKEKKKLIFLTIFIKKTRAEYRVIYPKYYKNLNEYCTFAVVEQLLEVGRELFDKVLCYWFQCIL